MNCNQLKKALSPYIDGEVNFLVRWKIKRHLRLCPDCQEELEQLEKIRRLSKLVLISSPEPHFYERLRIKLPQRKKKRENLWKIWTVLPYPGKVAILTGLAVALFLLVIYPYLFSSSSSILQFEEEYLRSREFFSWVEEPAPALIVEVYDEAR